MSLPIPHTYSELMVVLHSPIDLTTLVFLAIVVVWTPLYFGYNIGRIIDEIKATGTTEDNDSE